MKMKGQPQKRKLSKRKIHDNCAGYLCIAPIYIVFIFFVGIPILSTLCYYAYTKYNILQSPKWIGFDNFARFFADRLTPTIAWNAVRFPLFIVPAHVILGLLFAYGVYKIRSKPLKKVVRTTIYFPSIVSTTAVAIAWSFIYSKDFGWLNWMLKKLGLITENIGWTSSSKYAMLSIVIFSVWKFIGTAFLYYTVGLNNVPETYYEAARIDGANEGHIFFKIMLPLMTPSIFYVMLITMIGSIQAFDEPYFLTNGGPGDNTRTVALYLYEKAFNAYEMGYASSIASVLFVVIFVLTVIQFWLQNKWVNYDYD